MRCAKMSGWMMVGRRHTSSGGNDGKDDGVGKIASGFEMNVGLVWVGIDNE